MDTSNGMGGDDSGRSGRGGRRGGGTEEVTGEDQNWQARWRRR